MLLMSYRTKFYHFKANFNSTLLKMAVWVLLNAGQKKVIGIKNKGLLTSRYCRRGVYAICIYKHL